MKPKGMGLAWLLMATYMVSYLTRINYGAVLVDMVASTGFTKPELSMAVTGSFITYGIGQVVSGFFGDRIQPKRLVSLGFLITVCMNLLLPFCGTPWLMTAVWSINGVAQAFMWPPIVRLMVGCYSDEDYTRATVIVSWGSSIGSILVYLIAPVLVSLAGWQSMFWFSSLCGLLILPIWQKLCPMLPEERKEFFAQKGRHEGVGRLIASPLMLSILVCIVLQGTLRDGITTWMPTYVSETYDLGSSVSILTGVLLPIFSLISIWVVRWFFEKKLKHPMICSMLLFLLGALSAVVLYFLTGKNGPVSIFFMALLTGCMHGINLLLISFLPAYFKKTGHVSLISGILNSCTYVGSALSTYGIAVLTDAVGWKPTILVWLGIVVLGTILCAVNIPAWNRKFTEETV